MLLFPMVLRIEIHIMISLFSKNDCDTICSLHSLMNSVDHKTASQKKRIMVRSIPKEN